MASDSSQTSQSQSLVISASAVVLLLVAFIVFTQYKKDEDKDIKESYNIYVANQARQNKCSIL